MSHFALKKLKKTGTLVNIGSVHSFPTIKNFSVYSSSKIFLDYFTRIIQTEYKHKNILLVHPSGFKSNFNKSGNIFKIRNIKLQETELKILTKKIIKRFFDKKILLIGFRSKN